MSVIDAAAPSVAADHPESAPALFELRGITKEFAAGGMLARLSRRGPRLVAVADADLVLRRGAVLGLVGESGSGKSTLAQVAVRLEDPTAGHIFYRGEDVTKARGTALRRYRQRIQIVFQDTNSSLNPRKTVGRALAEPLALRGLPRRERRGSAAALLRSVGLGHEALERYPHQLSGGQRQRVGLARALAMEPELIVADEPVSSLDVSLQAQILLLLMELRRDLGLTMLFISHDLALVGLLSTELAVMFKGRIVERGSPNEVLRAPAHPYTVALIAAIPAGLAGRGRHQDRAAPPTEAPADASGCPYAYRCAAAMPQCHATAPPMVALSPTHSASCHRL